MTSKCNTENEKIWLDDLKSLFCSASFIPSGSLQSGARFNAISRLLIYSTLALVLMQNKYWLTFLIGSAVLLTGLYYTKNVSENYVYIPSQSTQVVNAHLQPTIPAMGQPLLNDPIRADTAENQLRLMPLNTANISNSSIGYFDKVVNVSNESGNRDDQAGIQYYSQKSGVNRRTLVQPVIAPRIYDLDYWGKASTVPSRINSLQVIDVTNEELNTSDMAQIPNRYPEAQGYKVAYPLALPVESIPSNPKGVWDMNKLNQDPDIGYYPSSENLWNSSNTFDFNRNVLPIYKNENSYVMPKVNFEMPATTTPTYVPWDAAITTPLPRPEWVGVTQEQVMQQSGGAPIREGFAFLPPPPNSFGQSFTEMSRVPPGQNAQIPAITSQLMYQSPTRTYTPQYFEAPNNKMFLQAVQPQLYSYAVEQTPINSSIGISYAPQIPPRVLDQITNNGMDMPLYTSIDPQLVRSDGTPGQLASQPTRTNWSAEYSNFQAPAGSINFEDIYDPRFSSYGDPYRSYSDVNLGLVQYYYSDIDAYKMPNFITRSNVDFVDFRTPQGQIWPEYARNTGIDEVRPHVENQVTADELFHREDMMSLQMNKRNREMWQLRFAPISTNGSNSTSNH